MNCDRFRIGNTFISITNPNDTVKCVEKAVENKQSGYICVSNMRTVKYANQHPDYCYVMNNAFMCIPDGMPLVWLGRIWGLKSAQRSNGPTLFQTMLNKPENGVKHFLLGDTEETLNQLKEKFHNPNIVGCYSPPFCGLEEYDFKGIAETINNSGADVVWISLRAPKQDFFSSRILPFLHGKICVGVGRAFRIAIGSFSDVPKWVQQFGLSGIWLRKVPLYEELWWYLRMSFSLMSYAIGIMLKRIAGKKYYE